MPGYFTSIKRSFLFGLGSFLILAAIGAVFQAAQNGRYEFALMALVSMALSVVAIRAAKKAPPSQSNLHAAVGWLIGFLIIDVVILVVVGATLMATRE